MWRIDDTPQGTTFSHQHDVSFMPSIRNFPLRARIHGITPSVDHEKVRSIVSRQREIDRLTDEQDILIFELLSSGVSAFMVQRFTRVTAVGQRAARGAALMNEVLHMHDPDHGNDAA